LSRALPGGSVRVAVQTLADLDGTKWEGSSELWLDPLGNQAIVSPCAIAVAGDVVRYTWSHEGVAQTGSITLAADGAAFVDTWHQPAPMPCRRLEGGGALFQVQGQYGPESDWGWRIALCLRTQTGELVLQMTNVTPWGEEGRAVRMVGRRA
jgi:hypothetical protein